MINSKILCELPMLLQWGNRSTCQWRAVQVQFEEAEICRRQQTVAAAAWKRERRGALVAAVFWGCSMAWSRWRLPLCGANSIFFLSCRCATGGHFGLQFQYYPISWTPSLIFSFGRLLHVNLYPQGQGSWTHFVYCWVAANAFKALVFSNMGCQNRSVHIVLSPSRFGQSKNR